MAGKIEKTVIPQIGDKSFQGNVLPGGDGQFDIGSSGKRWRRIFVKELVASQVTGVTVTGEDADTVDGLHAASTPEAGKLLALNGSSVFPDSVYPNAILADGTRPLTADWNAGSFTFTIGNIVVSGTVDGVDVSDHSARHDPGGADALTTAAPSTVQVQSNAEGSAGSFARSDHLHNISTGTPSSVQVQSNSAGSATSIARSDHLHNISTATPSTVQVQSNTEGSATSVARSDHLHSISTGTPSSPSVNLSSSAEGSATSLARSDHTHQLDQSIAPTWTGNHLWGTSNQIRLRDTALVIYSSTDGQLDIDADTELELTSPTVQINASTLFDVIGNMELEGGLTFIGAQTITTTNSGDLTIASSDDILLDPTGGTVSVTTDVELSTSNWSSGTLGWGIQYDGTADFRTLTADSLQVDVFQADSLITLAGALLITKSRARLSQNLTIPYQGNIVGVDTTNDYFSIDGNHTSYISASDTFVVSGSTGNDGTWTVSSTSYDSGNDETDIYVTGDITNGTVDGAIAFQTTLYVEDLEGDLTGWADVAVFASGDIVRLRYLDTSGGGLIVTDVWGTVTNYTDLSGGEQSWTFTVTNDGSVEWNEIYAGQIVLDYGQVGSGSRGVWKATVLDSAGAPYSQVATWSTDPWTSTNWTVHTRLGNLDGIYGIGLEYGLFAAQGIDPAVGVTATDAYVIISDSQVSLHNMPLTIEDGTAVRIKLDPSTPYLSVGTNAPTDYLQADGLWAGYYSTTPSWRMHVGDIDGEVFVWDGSSIKLGVLSSEHIEANGSTIAFMNGGTTTASLSGSVWTLGVSTAEHVVIDTSGVSLYDSGTMYGRFAATTTIGNTDTENIQITSSTLDLRDGTTTYARLSGSTLTLGQPGGSDYVTVAPSGIEMIANGVTVVDIDGTNGDFIFGQVATNKANIFWDQSAGQLNFRGGTDGTASYIYIDSAGTISAAISTTYQTTRAYRFTYSGTLHSAVQAYAHSTYNSVKLATQAIAGKTTNATVDATAAVGEIAVAALQANSTSGVFAEAYAYGTTRQFVVGEVGGGPVAIIDVTGLSGDIRTGGGLWLGASWSTSDPTAGYAVIEGGLRVGDTTSPTNDDIRAAGDLAVGSGVYAGSAGGEPSDGCVHYTGYLVSQQAAAHAVYGFHPLTTPYTHSNFDGNEDYSTVGTSTIIDNATWSTTIPSEAKALLLRIAWRDSGSAGSECFFAVGPSSTYWYGAIVRMGNATPVDTVVDNTVVVPCTNGDIYYRCTASGTNTMNVWLVCFGYWI